MIEHYRSRPSFACRRRPAARATRWPPPSRPSSIDSCHNSPEKKARIQMTEISTATLLVDCRCTLGEGIVWWPERRSPLVDRHREVHLMDASRRRTTSASLAASRSAGLLRDLRIWPLAAGAGKGPRLCRSRIGDDAEPRIGPAMSSRSAPAAQSHQRRQDRSCRQLRLRHDERGSGRSDGQLLSVFVAHGLRRLDVGGVIIPNSICFSLDGRTMYFCDSPEADPSVRLRRGSARVRRRSRVRPAERWQGQPDGSVVDREGCLWNAVWGAGMVRRYAPEGRLLGEINVPSKNATCVAFRRRCA